MFFVICVAVVCRTLQSDAALRSFMEEYARVDLPQLFVAHKGKGLFTTMFLAVVTYAPNMQGAQTVAVLILALIL